LFNAQPSKSAPDLPRRLLFTETEFANDLAVSIYVFTVEVVKKTTTLTDHFQQTSSACVVVLVLSQVVC
jgi:hypothetical protein